MPKQFTITLQDNGTVEFSHPGVIMRSFQRHKRAWSPTGYIDLPVGMFKFHKLVMQLCKPNPAPDIFTDVDHADGDVGNFHPSNLFWVTRQMNALNQKHARGYVEKHGKYEARLHVGRYWSLGTFDTWWEAKTQTDFYRALVLRYLRKHWDDYVATRNPGETPDSLVVTVDPYDIDPHTLSSHRSPASPPRRGRACFQRRTRRHYVRRTKGGSSQ